MTYERLKALIATGRKGSKAKLLQRNTYVEERDNGAIAVRLHRTGEIDFNAACYKRFGVEGY